MNLVNNNSGRQNSLFYKELHFSPNLSLVIVLKQMKYWQFKGRIVKTIHILRASALYNYESIWIIPQFIGIVLSFIIIENKYIFIKPGSYSWRRIPHFNRQKLMFCQSSSFKSLFLIDTSMFCFHVTRVFPLFLRFIGRYSVILLVHLCLSKISTSYQMRCRCSIFSV